MTTTVSSKGQIVLPAGIRRQDDLKPGQQFEIERVPVRPASLKLDKIKLFVCSDPYPNHEAVLQITNYPVVSPNPNRIQ